MRFHISEDYQAVVTVDSNLLEYIEIATRGNTLTIRTKNGNYSFTKYLVDVYCPIVTGVSVSGSGSFKGIDDINASSFTSNVSGSGKIEGTIECDALSAKISGSGKISVIGNGYNSNIEISGSGTFSGNEFILNKAAIRISGSGKANINVSEDLNVDISGSGEVNYRGNPKVDSKISGSGRIRKM